MINETLTISGEDVVLSSPEVNEGRPLKVGRVANRVFYKNESFNGLLKKYAAWTLYKDILSIADEIRITVEEENGTSSPDEYIFTLRTEEVFKRGFNTISDQTNIKKAILPLSWFKLTIKDNLFNSDKARKLSTALGPEWYFLLRNEFNKDYMKKLSHFLKEERKIVEICPSTPDVFRAMRVTPFSDVKVVILGQDPYHNGLAEGLSFSSIDPLTTPKSLANIFTEIENDIYGGLMLDRDPQLTRWAKQGVLLLNTCLTVRKGVAGSHRNQGWEQFTSESFME